MWLGCRLPQRERASRWAKTRSEKDKRAELLSSSAAALSQTICWFWTGLNMWCRSMSQLSVRSHAILTESSLPSTETLHDKVDGSGQCCLIHTVLDCRLVIINCPLLDIFHIRSWSWLIFSPLSVKTHFTAQTDSVRYLSIYLTIHTETVRNSLVFQFKFCSTDPNTWKYKEAVLNIKSVKLRSDRGWRARLTRTVCEETQS